MTDRADELATELIPQHAVKIMVDTRSGDRKVYSAEEWRAELTAILRAYAEEARREEMVECGRVLFGIADEFDALASTQIGNEIVYGVLTDQSCFVRNLATTIGAVEPAVIRARGEKG